MGDFGFLPDGTPVYGDALDGRYPDYEETPPGGLYIVPGQPGQPYRRAGYGWQRPQAEDRPAPGRPPQDPRRGYPPAPGGARPTSGPGSPAARAYGGPAPGSGPRPAPAPGKAPRPAPAPGGQATRAYGGPASGYRPTAQRSEGYRADSGPMRAYRPEGGARPGYQPGAYRNEGYRTDSGPIRAYRPEGGPGRGQRHESGSARGQRPAGTSLIADYPPGTGPIPAYRQPDIAPMPSYLPPDIAPMPAYRPSGGLPAGEDLPTGGRRVPGWLPFSYRLVLLPKTAGPAGEELREHRDVSGGWLRPAVFGAMDGLVTNSSLIAGIGGGGGGHGMIVLTGIAGLIAGAFSMATGEYISVTSQNELTAAEVELERKQHARDPRGKRSRLTQVYVEKGVSPNLAEAVVRQISADPERAVATHVREELGIDPDDLPSARTAAIASFAAFTVGALIPLSPFLAGLPDLTAALAIAGLSAFAGGAAVAKLTGRSMVLGGLRQFAAAFLATGMAFLIGHIVGGHVS